MDNQHRLIKGYRELSQSEIDLMNEVKAMGVMVGELVAKVQKSDEYVVVDQRWAAIGRTHLQEGFMALTRSIAKPDTF